MMMKVLVILLCNFNHRSVHLFLKWIYYNKVKRVCKIKDAQNKQKVSRKHWSTPYCYFLRFRRTLKAH